MIPKRGDLGGAQIHSGSFGGGYHHPTYDYIFKEYTVKEILDNIGIEDIELYLRKKKLDKINKKIKK